ncbi:hypothetical protein Cni_G21331 [Canna indica]|uniref:Uncharacterized protein n=1 Tax=Canna indica TaxID=4628 RepID=A0AAQ3KPR1_9LILI|nr:hypothetical protein Cni_G21331 [Canna indica]
MAAAAGLPTDFNEDDFDEYNPHPYLGGYDIALTYGQSLPPSSATCYPISNQRATPSPPPPPPPAVVDPPPFDYGLPDNYQPEPFPSPDLFRGWPFSNWEDHKTADGDPEASAGWNGWKRALDYLFGHAQGYGERRVGVDSYGIPIYANKKLGRPESVVVEVEPAPVQMLQYYDNPDSWSSRYSGTADKHDHGNADISYNKHCSNEALHVEVDRNQSAWHHGYGDADISYNKHYANEALHVVVDPNESIWHQKLNYHEANVEHIHHDSAFDEGNFVTAFFGSPGIAYNKHHYEPVLHVQVEPVETSWSQESSYSDVYQESALPKSDWSSSYYDGPEGEINFFGSSGHYYQRHSPEPSDSVELEPFKPTWSQNLGHHEEYEEEYPMNWANHWNIWMWEELENEVKGKNSR